MIATIGVLDALDSLSLAAAAAACPAKRSSSSRWLHSGTGKNPAAKVHVTVLQQHQQPLLDEEQQQVPTGNTSQAAEAASVDIESAETAAVTIDAHSMSPTTELNGQCDHKQQQGVVMHQDSGGRNLDQQQHSRGGFTLVKQMVLRHTGWMRPWLPLALNLEQFKHIYSILTTDLPRMLSSKRGELSCWQCIAGVLGLEPDGQLPLHRFQSLK